MTAPISSISPISIPELSKAAPWAAQGGDFQKVLESTIHTLESMRHDAGDTVQKFLTGENEELHTAVLATQQAALGFELGLAVRNKVVDAYQEIMRMQI